jgi:outer membrane protein OmpA-like peptidoglycan-associated protein
MIARFRTWVFRKPCLKGLKNMMNRLNTFNSFPRQLALFALASAIAIPVWAQDQVNTGITNTQNSQPAAASQNQQPSPTAQQPLTPPKEGFWGRVNPFARKKWVKKQIDPINDRLSELDEVNAKNARDIKDVDARAQAGIQRAQQSADQANQLASTANTQAQNASNTAQQASQHVDNINSTVNGLDQYHQITEAEITFRSGSSVLTDDSKAKLDELAASLTGREGYIVEIEAHSPGAGSVGIQNSERLAEAVKRYLVTEHQIPVYRMHAVALGNEMAMNPESSDQSQQAQNQKPERVRKNTVHLTLMENSLAARTAASPQSAATPAGTEQP